MPSEEHEAIVAMVQASPPGSGSVEESRAGFDAMLSMFPLPDDADIEEINIQHMNADWVRVPETSGNRVVLYFHGGGYVIGNNVGYREFASRMARATRSRVLLINYRLAPENPFPAAVDDAVMAYRWLLEQGTPPEQIMVAGDSAGGGLTLATLVALRDGGTPLPACATCFSPWVDLEGGGDSAQPGAVDDPMVGLQTLQGMSRHYAGDDLRNPLAAPLYADLSGLPPLQVFAGTREILLSDATRIVDNAQAAGVSASLTVGDGLIHVWQLFANVPEAAESLKQVGEFADKHLP
jgi:acetyl esterase/lipase